MRAFFLCMAGSKTRARGHHGKVSMVPGIGNAPGQLRYA
jgi:hypothetical protein